MFRKKSSEQSREVKSYPIVLPLLIGLSAFVALFSAMNHDVIGDETLKRYLAGHTVSKVTTALFLIGLASLCLIAKDVYQQLRRLPKITLGPAETPDTSTGPSSGEVVKELQTKLNNMACRSDYLWKRIQSGLNYVQRNDSAEGLAEELKYAAESDLDEKHDRYAFARIMIWAIPMLGFLGTVLGISEALGGIEVGENNDFQQMMAGLRSSLYVAFDTTAVALTFAILLMFVQFGVDRMETALLTRVSHRASQELSLHWQVNNHAKDQYVKTVERIGEKVLQSTEQLVEKQVKLWRTSISAAESAWIESVNGAQANIRESLQQTLDESTSQLGERLCQAIRQSEQATEHRWEQWQVTLSENARVLASHLDRLSEQTVVLLEQAQLQEKQIQAHEQRAEAQEQQAQQLNQLLLTLGDLSETKQQLAAYLKSLPSSVDFSDAQKQLSVAVRLLEFRLGNLLSDDTTSHPSHPTLASSRSFDKTSRAA